MADKLKELMAKPTTARTTDDYEGVMNDLVAFAGGHRIEDVFQVPGQRNADYYFDCADFDCVMELKQAWAYDGKKTVQSFFDGMFREGRIVVPDGVSVGSEMTVDNTNMAPRDWAHFYKKFRPSVVGALGDADRQLRITDGWLPKRRPVRIKGVFVLNSGDFNLPSDLLGRIVAKKVQREWRGGHFENTDFAMSGALDMYLPGQHPWSMHQLVRDQRPELNNFAWHLKDKWIRYAAAELGFQVEFTPRPGASTTPEYREVVTPYQGKIQFPGRAGLS